MPIISAYKPYTNKEGKCTAGCIPYDSTLEQEIQDIIIGKHIDIINQLRAITDQEEKRTFKAAKLPCFTVSSVCESWRNTENIVNHTGLLCIDIDAHNNPHIEDWGKLRDDLFTHGKSIVSAFISASGKGLAVIFKILPAHHFQVFNTIMHELAAINITIDIQCKDLVRIRFSSYDKDAKIRPIEETELALPNDKYEHEEPKITFKPSRNVNSIKTFKHAIDNANQWGKFQDGYKHHYLLRVAAYCNLVGMDENTCKGFIIDTFGDKTHITQSDLIKPITLVYRSYKAQHATKQLPKPEYSLKILKWLLKYIKKELLKQYIDIYGQDTYVGTDGTYTVESKLLAFFMHIVAPNYTWTILDTPNKYTTEEIKDIIKPDCLLDSCNGQRIWVNKDYSFPTNW
jgi:hypothetical protein